MTTWTITEETVTLRYAGGTETRYLVHPEGTEYQMGADHYSTTKREAAEAFAAARQDGMTYAQAERAAFGLPQRATNTEPATETQRATVTRLLATADLTDIEGSIPLPRRETLTKSDASWWITRLSH